MKEVIKGTLPNKKDVLRPTKTPVAKKPKQSKQSIVEAEPTLIETVKTISKGGIIQESSISVLHILAFILLIPGAILALPGFCLLLLADHLKED